MRGVFQTYEGFARPVATGDSIAATLGIYGDFAQGFCDFQKEAVPQAAFGWNLISARGLAGNDVNAEQYIHDFLVYVIAHEVGHTLGLRHNFKASTIHPVVQLHNKALTMEQGITSSVMDYQPPNIAPEGQKQGQYYQTTLGPYDYWAIEYAYTPIPKDSKKSEAAILEEIASRVADPKVPYGTDEDAFFGPRGVDPTCTRWDLGADPIPYYRGRVSLAQELWSKIEPKFEKPGSRYQKFRDVFNQGISQYFIAVSNVAKYIGGHPMKQWQRWSFAMVCDLVSSPVGLVGVFVAILLFSPYYEITDFLLSVTGVIVFLMLERSLRLLLHYVLSRKMIQILVVIALTAIPVVGFIMMIQGESAHTALLLRVSLITVILHHLFLSYLTAGLSGAYIQSAQRGLKRRQPRR